jgi:hypothetical protein
MFRQILKTCLKGKMRFYPKKWNGYEIQLLRGAISSLHSCIADMFFLKIAFNDTRLLLAAS